MNRREVASLASMEGQTFVIGREGHIYINDQSVSRQHAEIRFIDGRIRLRDLNSTNGTYLVKGSKLIYFQEGYVKPHYQIVLGRKLFEIKSLLAILGIFAEYSDDSGLAIQLDQAV